MNESLTFELLIYVFKVGGARRSRWWQSIKVSDYQGIRVSVHAEILIFHKIGYNRE